MGDVAEKPTDKKYRGWRREVEGGRDLRSVCAKNDVIWSVCKVWVVPGCD
jgi:hypothetical protein